MNGPLYRRILVQTAACAVVAAAVAGSAANAESTPACSSSTETPYRIQLRALTGPAGADLRVTAATDVVGCAVPTALKKVQLKTFAADGTLASTRNVTDVAAPGGVANLDLGQVPRQRRVEVEALVQTGTPERTYVLRGETTTLLRPDLVVETIAAPEKVLLGRPFSATVVIAERNGDVGATAAVALAGATAPVEVGPGGTATVVFPAATLTTRGHVDLAAAVREASPAETNATNNARTTTVEVLLPPDLVVELKAPLFTLTTKPADVTAVVTEKYGDVGANAVLKFWSRPGLRK